MEVLPSHVFSVSNWPAHVPLISQQNCTQGIQRITQEKIQYSVRCQLSEHFSWPNPQNLIVARADMKNCLTTPFISIFIIQFSMVFSYLNISVILSVPTCSDDWHSTWQLFKRLMIAPNCPNLSVMLQLMIIT